MLASPEIEEGIEEAEREVGREGDVERSFRDPVEDKLGRVGVGESCADGRGGVSRKNASITSGSSRIWLIIFLFSSMGDITPRKIP